MVEEKGEGMMHAHWIGDVGYYAAFLAGQGLFVLSCAAAALRNKTNPVKTRREYVAHNWDILAIRAGAEMALVFYVWRHHLIGAVVALTGWTLPDWTAIPQSPMGAFALGFVADGLLNWALKSPKVPDWAKERIPALNGLSQSLQTAAAANVKAGVANLEAGDAIAEAQAAAPVQSAASKAPFETQDKPEPPAA
jgi:hypothetical protein